MQSRTSSNASFFRSHAAAGSPQQQRGGGGAAQQQTPPPPQYQTATPQQGRQREPSPVLPRLHELVRQQDFKAVVLHLDRVGYADVNLQDHKGRTALHLACLLNSVEIVWILLRRGAYVHASTDRNQLCPLHCACIKGNLAIARMLLKYGADPTTTNADGITPIQLLPKDRECQKFAKAVLKPVIDQYKPSKKDKELLARVAVKDEKGLLDMIEKGGDVNTIEDKTFMTPLMVAARNGDDDCVRSLLFHCADVHRQDIAKNTALHWACARGSKIICELLIEFDASVNIADRESGYTPLHWAVNKNHADLIPMLCIKYKANPNLPDKEGMTPLHGACRKLGLGHCVDVLLKMPHIDVNIPDAYGVHPLHSAIRKNDPRIVQALLVQGKADPNVITVTGTTPLHDACEEPNPAIVKMILEAPNGTAHINTPNDDGFSPLFVTIDHLSKKRANQRTASAVLDVIKLLCSKGADPNHRDKGLRTPLMMLDLNLVLDENALENKIARLLVSLNADISLLHRVVFNRELPQDLKDKIKDVVEYLQRKKLADQREQMQSFTGPSGGATNGGAGGAAAGGAGAARLPPGWRQVTENGETFYVDEVGVRCQLPTNFMVSTDPRLSLAQATRGAISGAAVAAGSTVDDEEETSSTAGGLALSEVSCPLCLEILFRPCTTECGHNFCQPCMEEALRFHSMCPVCRKPVKAPVDYTVNAMMSNIIQRAFPERYAVRQREFDQLRPAGGATRR